MSRETPKITVAVVTYNAELHIGRCIESILALNYPAQAVELLIVDGCSADATQMIVRRFMKKDSRIRLVENPERTIASNRNRALKEARYPFVAFTDSDCEVPENWLTVLMEAFQERRGEQDKLIAVGGANVPPQENGSSFLQALGIMLNTFLGSLGSVQGKVYSESRYVDSLACLNVIYDRDRVLSLGGFDTDMKNIGEDAEMHFRLRKAGYRLLYVPASTVYHKLRPTPREWARNMFNYGRGRMVMFRKHHEMITFRYLLPLFFLAAFLAVPFSGLSRLCWLPMAYFPLLLVYSLGLAVRQKQLCLSGWIMLAFLYTHWCYAFGMVWQGLSWKKTM